MTSAVLITYGSESLGQSKRPSWELHERALLKEFDEYRESPQRTLKVFRLEAVRAGFRRAWQERDYATIVAVAGKVPEAVLQEDPKLLMWYDQAMTRSGASSAP